MAEKSPQWQHLQGTHLYTFGKNPKQKEKSKECSKSSWGANAVETCRLGASRVGWSVKNRTIRPSSCFNNNRCSRWTESALLIAISCASLQDQRTPWLEQKSGLKTIRGFKKIQWQHQQWFFLPQSDKCILKWDHKTKDKLLTSSRLPTKYESVLLLHTTSAFQPVWQDCILHQHLLPSSALPLPVSLTPQSSEAHAAGTLHAEKCTVLIIIPQNSTHLGQNPCEFFFTLYLSVLQEYPCLYDRQTSLKITIVQLFMWQPKTRE